MPNRRWKSKCEWVYQCFILDTFRMNSVWSVIDKVIYETVLSNPIQANIATACLFIVEFHSQTTLLDPLFKPHPAQSAPNILATPPPAPSFAHPRRSKSADSSRPPCMPLDQWWNSLTSMSSSSRSSWPAWSAPSLSKACRNLRPGLAKGWPYFEDLFVTKKKKNRSLFLRLGKAPPGNSSGLSTAQPEISLEPATLWKKLNQ